MILNSKQLRSHAATLGIKIIGATNASLLEQIFLPEIGDKVCYTRRKQTDEAFFTGLIQCKKTFVFYAKMKTLDKKKRFIIQLKKLSPCK